MAQTSQLSPELSRGLLQLARALLVAARSWMLYPPEHPTVRSSVQRLAAAITEASLGAVFSIGVTPETLMIEATAADASQAAIAEAAALLHDRDLLRLTFLGDVPVEALHTFLRILSLDPAERRARGGPADIWAVEGHPSIALQQIDYARVLLREEGEVAAPARRDDLWRSIVTSIAGGQQAMFDEHQQQRLLEIAGSPADIADLAVAASAPKCTSDGSPMVTTQAATVLAAFRHLTSIASVMTPDRGADVMRNLASASTQIDAHVIMQVMQSEGDAVSAPILQGLAHAFDDEKVAQLLATALALDGRASDRLATVFNTIAPDDDRKRRVLTMTKSLLNESDFGRSGQFQVLWTSMEELLVSYDEKPYVSTQYRAALDGIGERAERLAAAGELPSELPDWLTTLGQDNVRSLSVSLLIDLLTIEQDAARASEIADDMTALTEDLLLAGAYADALAVTTAMARRANSSLLGRDACRVALDRLGESIALVETVSLLGDVGEEDWTAIKAVLEAVGLPAVEALKPAVAVEHDGPGVSRAESTIVGFGAAAVTRLGSLVADPRWFVQRRGARLLGRIAAPEAIPLLQPLVRQSDARVAREAISALAAIDDPAAARAIHTVLRAAAGPLRRAVIDALVSGKDARIVPMLARILDESEPLGRDHEMVLETASALGAVGTDGAVPPLVALARRKRWFGGRKLRTLKETSVDALLRVGTSSAETALRGAAESGDRALKKIVAARVQSGPARVPR